MQASMSDFALSPEGRDVEGVHQSTENVELMEPHSPPSRDDCGALSNNQLINEALALYSAEVLGITDNEQDPSPLVSFPPIDPVPIIGPEAFKFSKPKTFDGASNETYTTSWDDGLLGGNDFDYLTTFSNEVTVTTETSTTVAEEESVDRMVSNPTGYSLDVLAPEKDAQGFQGVGSLQMTTTPATCKNVIDTLQEEPTFFEVIDFIRSSAELKDCKSYYESAASEMNAEGSPGDVTPSNTNLHIVPMSNGIMDQASTSPPENFVATAEQLGAVVEEGPVLSPDVAKVPMSSYGQDSLPSPQELASPSLKGSDAVSCCGLTGQIVGSRIVIPYSGECFFNEIDSLDSIDYGPPNLVRSDDPPLLENENTYEDPPELDRVDQPFCATTKKGVKITTSTLASAAGEDLLKSAKKSMPDIVPETSQEGASQDELNDSLGKIIPSITTDISNQISAGYNISDIYDDPTISLETNPLCTDGNSPGSLVLLPVTEVPKTFKKISPTKRKNQGLSPVKSCDGPIVPAICVRKGFVNDLLLCEAHDESNSSSVVKNDRKVSKKNDSVNSTKSSDFLVGGRKYGNTFSNPKVIPTEFDQALLQPGPILQNTNASPDSKPLSTPSKFEYECLANISSTAEVGHNCKKVDLEIAAGGEKENPLAIKSSVATTPITFTGNGNVVKTFIIQRISSKNSRSVPSGEIYSESVSKTSVGKFQSNSLINSSLPEKNSMVHQIVQQRTKIVKIPELQIVNVESIPKIEEVVPKSPVKPTALKVSSPIFSLNLHSVDQNLSSETKKMERYENPKEHYLPSASAVKTIIEPNLLDSSGANCTSSSKTISTIEPNDKFSSPSVLKTNDKHALSIDTLILKSLELESKELTVSVNPFCEKNSRENIPTAKEKEVEVSKEDLVMGSHESPQACQPDVQSFGIEELMIDQKDHLCETAPKKLNPEPSDGDMSTMVVPSELPLQPNKLVAKADDASEICGSVVIQCKYENPVVISEELADKHQHDNEQCDLYSELKAKIVKYGKESDSISVLTNIIPLSLVEQPNETEKMLSASQVDNNTAKENLAAETDTSSTEFAGRSITIDSSQTDLPEIRLEALVKFPDTLATNQETDSSIQKSSQRDQEKESLLKPDNLPTDVLKKQPTVDEQKNPPINIHSKDTKKKRTTRSLTKDSSEPSDFIVDPLERQEEKTAIIKTVSLLKDVESKLQKNIKKKLPSKGLPKDSSKPPIPPKQQEEKTPESETGSIVEDVHNKPSSEIMKKIQVEQPISSILKDVHSTSPKNGSLSKVAQKSLASVVCVPIKKNPQNDRIPKDVQKLPTDILLLYDSKLPEFRVDSSQQVEAKISVFNDSAQVKDDHNSPPTFSLTDVEKPPTNSLLKDVEIKLPRDIVPKSDQIMQHTESPLKEDQIKRPTRTIPSDSQKKQSTDTLLNVTSKSTGFLLEHLEENTPELETGGLQKDVESKVPICSLKNVQIELPTDRVQKNVRTKRTTGSISKDLQKSHASDGLPTDVQIITPSDNLPTESPKLLCINVDPSKQQEEKSPIPEKDSTPKDFERQQLDDSLPKDIHEENGTDGSVKGKLEGSTAILYPPKHQEAKAPVLKTDGLTNDVQEKLSTDSLPKDTKKKQPAFNLPKDLSKPSNNIVHSPKRHKEKMPFLVLKTDCQPKDVQEKQPIELDKCKGDDVLIAVVHGRTTKLVQKARNLAHDSPAFKKTAVQDEKVTTIKIQPEITSNDVLPCPVTTMVGKQGKQVDSPIRPEVPKPALEGSKRRPRTRSETSVDKKFLGDGGAQSRGIEEQPMGTNNPFSPLMDSNDKSSVNDVYDFTDEDDEQSTIDQFRNLSGKLAKSKRSSQPTNKTIQQSNLTPRGWDGEKKCSSLGRITRKESFKESSKCSKRPSKKSPLAKDAIVPKISANKRLSRSQDKLSFPQKTDGKSSDSNVSSKELMVQVSTRSRSKETISESDNISPTRVLRNRVKSPILNHSVTVVSNHKVHLDTVSKDNDGITVDKKNTQKVKSKVPYKVEVSNEKCDITIIDSTCPKKENVTSKQDCQKSSAEGGNPHNRMKTRSSVMKHNQKMNDYSDNESSSNKEASTFLPKLRSSVSKKMPLVSGIEERNEDACRKQVLPVNTVSKIYKSVPQREVLEDDSVPLKSEKVSDNVRIMMQKVRKPLPVGKDKRALILTADLGLNLKEVDKTLPTCGDKDKSNIPKKIGLADILNPSSLLASQETPTSNAEAVALITPLMNSTENQELETFHTMSDMSEQKEPEGAKSSTRTAQLHSFISLTEGHHGEKDKKLAAVEKKRLARERSTSDGKRIQNNIILQDIDEAPRILKNSISDPVSLVSTETVNFVNNPDDIVDHQNPSKGNNVKNSKTSRSGRSKDMAADEAEIDNGENTVRRLTRSSFTNIFQGTDTTPHKFSKNVNSGNLPTSIKKNACVNQNVELNESSYPKNKKASLKDNSIQDDKQATVDGSGQEEDPLTEEMQKPIPGQVEFPHTNIEDSINLSKSNSLRNMDKGAETLCSSGKEIEVAQSKNDKLCTKTGDIVSSESDQTSSDVHVRKGITNYSTNQTSLYLNPKPTFVTPAMKKFVHETLSKQNLEEISCLKVDKPTEKVSSSRRKSKIIHPVKTVPAANTGSLIDLGPKLSIREVCLTSEELGKKSLEKEIHEGNLGFDLSDQSPGKSPDSTTQSRTEGVVSKLDQESHGLNTPKIAEDAQGVTSTTEMESVPSALLTETASNNSVRNQYTLQGKKEDESVTSTTLDSKLSIPYTNIDGERKHSSESNVRHNSSSSIGWASSTNDKGRLTSSTSGVKDAPEKVSTHSEKAELEEHVWNATNTPNQSPGCGANDDGDANPGYGILHPRQKIWRLNPDLSKFEPPDESSDKVSLSSRENEFPNMNKSFSNEELKRTPLKKRHVKGMNLNENKSLDGKEHDEALKKSDEEQIMEKDRLQSPSSSVNQLTFSIYNLLAPDPADKNADLRSSTRESTLHRRNRKSTRKKRKHLKSVFVKGSRKSSNTTKRNSFILKRRVLTRISAPFHNRNGKTHAKRGNKVEKLKKSKSVAPEKCVSTHIDKPPSKVLSCSSKSDANSEPPKSASPEARNGGIEILLSEGSSDVGNLNPTQSTQNLLAVYSFCSDRKTNPEFKPKLQQPVEPHEFSSSNPSQSNLPVPYCYNSKHITQEAQSIIHNHISELEVDVHDKEDEPSPQYSPVITKDSTNRNCGGNVSPITSNWMSCATSIVKQSDSGTLELASASNRFTVSHQDSAFQRPILERSRSFSSEGSTARPRARRESHPALSPHTPVDLSFNRKTIRGGPISTLKEGTSKTSNIAKIDLKGQNPTFFSSFPREVAIYDITKNQVVCHTPCAESSMNASYYDDMTRTSAAIPIRPIPTRKQHTYPTSYPHGYVAAGELTLAGNLQAPHTTFHSMKGNSSDQYPDSCYKKEEFNPLLHGTHFMLTPDIINSMSSIPPMSTGPLNLPMPSNRRNKSNRTNRGKFGGFSTTPKVNLSNPKPRAPAAESRFALQEDSSFKFPFNRQVFKGLSSYYSDHNYNLGVASETNYQITSATSNKKTRLPQKYEEISSANSIKFLAERKVSGFKEENNSVMMPIPNDKASLTSRTIIHGTSSTARDPILISPELSITPLNPGKSPRTFTNRNAQEQTCSKNHKGERFQTPKSSHRESSTTEKSRQTKPDMLQQREGLRDANMTYTQFVTKDFTSISSSHSEKLTFDSSNTSAILKSKSSVFNHYGSGETTQRSTAHPASVPKKDVSPPNSSKADLDSRVSPPELQSNVDNFSVNNLLLNTEKKQSIPMASLDKEVENRGSAITVVCEVGKTSLDEDKEENRGTNLIVMEIPTEDTAKLTFCLQSPPQSTNESNSGFDQAALFHEREICSSEVQRDCVPVEQSYDNSLIETASNKQTITDNTSEPALNVPSTSSSSSSSVPCEESCVDLTLPVETESLRKDVGVVISKSTEINSHAVLLRQTSNFSSISTESSAASSKSIIDHKKQLIGNSSDQHTIDEEKSTLDKDSPICNESTLEDIADHSPLTPNPVDENTLCSLKNLEDDIPDVSPSYVPGTPPSIVLHDTDNTSVPSTPIVHDTNVPVRLSDSSLRNGANGVPDTQDDDSSGASTRIVSKVQLSNPDHVLPNIVINHNDALANVVSASESENLPIPSHIMQAKACSQPSGCTLSDPTDNIGSILKSENLDSKPSLGVELLHDASNSSTTPLSEGNPEKVRLVNQSLEELKSSCENVDPSGSFKNLNLISKSDFIKSSDELLQYDTCDSSANPLPEMNSEEPKPTNPSVEDKIEKDIPAEPSGSLENQFLFSELDVGKPSGQCLGVEPVQHDTCDSKSSIENDFPDEPSEARKNLVSILESDVLKSSEHCLAVVPLQLDTFNSSMNPQSEFNSEVLKFADSFGDDNKKSSSEEASLSDPSESSGNLIATSKSDHLKCADSFPVEQLNQQETCDHSVDQLSEVGSEVLKSTAKLSMETLHSEEIVPAHSASVLPAELPNKLNVPLTPLNSSELVDSGRVNTTNPDNCITPVSISPGSDSSTINTQVTEAISGIGSEEFNLPSKLSVLPLTSSPSTLGSRHERKRKFSSWSETDREEIVIESASIEHSPGKESDLMNKCQKMRRALIKIRPLSPNSLEKHINSGSKISSYDRDQIKMCWVNFQRSQGSVSSIAAVRRAESEETSKTTEKHTRSDKSGKMKTIIMGNETPQPSTSYSYRGSLNFAPPLSRLKESAYMLEKHELIRKILSSKGQKRTVSEAFAQGVKVCKDTSTIIKLNVERASNRPISVPKPIRSPMTPSKPSSVNRTYRWIMDHLRENRKSVQRNVSVQCCKDFLAPTRREVLPNIHPTDPLLTSSNRPSSSACHEPSPSTLGAMPTIVISGSEDSDSGGSETTTKENDEVRKRMRRKLSSSLYLSCSCPSPGPSPSTNVCSTCRKNRAQGSFSTVQSFSSPLYTKVATTQSRQPDRVVQCAAAVGGGEDTVSVHSSTVVQLLKNVVSLNRNYLPSNLSPITTTTYAPPCSFSSGDPTPPGFDGYSSAYQEDLMPPRRVTVSPGPLLNITSTRPPSETARGSGTASQDCLLEKPIFEPQTQLENNDSDFQQSSEPAYVSQCPTASSIPHERTAGTSASCSSLSLEVDDRCMPRDTSQVPSSNSATLTSAVASSSVPGLSSQDGAPSSSSQINREMSHDDIPEEVVMTSQLLGEPPLKKKRS